MPDWALAGKILKVQILSGPTLAGQSAVQRDFTLGHTVPVATALGRMDLQFKLFGLIPFHHLVVNVVPTVRVIPGGHSIGVLLHAQGVMVVGQSVVIDQQGKRHNPAVSAGIQSGDIIVKVNGRPARNDRQIRDEIVRSGEIGRAVVLEVKRGNRIFTTRVNPVLCTETGRYRIGIFIRDSVAGVGTITFYEPQSKKYGALGHVITDMDTAHRIDLADGRIVEAVVQGIHPGRRGQPGEKIGLFNGRGVMGDIEKNTSCGIFGSLREPLHNSLYRHPLPVAFSYQVKEGPTEMLTVLNGNRVERFSIEILEVMPQARREAKGMVIRITDRELLKNRGDYSGDER